VPALRTTTPTGEPCRPPTPRQLHSVHLGLQTERVSGLRAVTTGTLTLDLSGGQTVISIQTVAGFTPATRACAPTVSEFYSRHAGLCPVPPDSSEGVHKWGDRLSGEPPASKPSPSAYLTGALVHDQAEDGNSANNNA
jgi:hypothetical protein